MIGEIVRAHWISKVDPRGIEKAVNLCERFMRAQELVRQLLFANLSDTIAAINKSGALQFSYVVKKIRPETHAIRICQRLP